MAFEIIQNLSPEKLNESYIRELAVNYGQLPDYGQRYLGQTLFDSLDLNVETAWRYPYTEVLTEFKESFRKLGGSASSQRYFILELEEFKFRVSFPTKIQAATTFIACWRRLPVGAHYPGIGGDKPYADPLKLIHLIRKLIELQNSLTDIWQNEYATASLRVKQFAPLQRKVLRRCLKNFPWVTQIEHWYDRPCFRVELSHQHTPNALSFYVPVLSTTEQMQEFIDQAARDVVAFQKLMSTSSIHAPHSEEILTTIAHTKRPPNK